MMLFLCDSSLHCRHEGGLRWLLASLGLLAVSLGAMAAGAEEVPEESCVRIELFMRGDSDRSKKAEAFLVDLERRRPGVKVEVLDVVRDRAALERLHALSARFARKPAVPTVYACDQLVVGFRDAATTGAQIEGLLTMEIFYRDGCPRCAAAMPYLLGIKRRYPGLSLVVREVGRDLNAQIRMNQLCESYRMIPGLPTVHFGGRLSVGWSGLETTGAQIEGLVKQACTACRTRQEPASVPQPSRAPPRTSWSPGDLFPSITLPLALFFQLPPDRQRAPPSLSQSSAPVAQPAAVPQAGQPPKATRTAA